MRHRLAALVATLGLTAATGAWLQSQGQPVFQAAVDVIPVDVQVVDSLGRPVTGLTADKFEVTVNGRRRRVVSASLIDLRPSASRSVGATSSTSSTPAVPSAPTPSTDGIEPPRRIFILAVDASSFDESTGRAVLRTAAEFASRLSPIDELGLFTYPIGPKIDPTTDHEAIARALESVVARRETPPRGEFFLSPSTLAELAGPRPITAQEIHCGPRTDPDFLDCVDRLMSQVAGEVLFYEGVAQGAMGTLQSLMLELGKIAERKVLVLVSGGVVGSDVNGRPDLRSIGFELGRTAARANVSVYSLFLDQSWAAAMSAETGRATKAYNPGRDSAIMNRWVDEFSGSAGGSMMRIATGTGSTAFDRILSETSAYYLLAVEPAPAERDGRSYELRVRVNAPNVSVRGRSWVVVPKPGEAAERMAALATTRPVVPTTVAAPTALPPTPPAVRALAEAYERDDRAAIAKALEPRNADTVVEAFRTSESPWPASPKHTAAFALELAVTGLRSSSTFTRDASGRLLGEYAIRVRQADPADPFECAWFWAATAALQGLYHVDAGPVFAQRGVDRCPADPSLRLALAVVLDQQWTENLLPSTKRWSSNASTALERRLLDAYAAASGSPLTRYEANVRAAFVHYRAGRVAEGLALAEGTPTGGEDRQILYLGLVIRGLLLGASDRTDDAVGVLRSALAIWPGQAARVSLAAALIRRGEFDEAAALADRIMSAPASEQDPWWLYHLGDYRGYSVIRAKLRTLAQ